MSDLPLVYESVGLDAGRVTLVDGIDLTIGRGALTVLIGPNGSGKTSLIRLGMGLERPSRGRISWGGEDSGQNRGKDRGKDRGKNGGTVGGRAIVLQRPAMLRRSVAANVAYALAGTSKAGRARVGELLGEVGLAQHAGRPARRLSGGEQQRLAIARAMAREPELLFLDEPTASLDPAATKAVEDIVRSVAARGVTIVMATHDLGQARRIGGRIVFLARGRIVEQAPAATFFAAPRTRQAAAFLRGDLVA